MRCQWFLPPDYLHLSARHWSGSSIRACYHRALLLTFFATRCLRTRARRWAQRCCCLAAAWDKLILIFMILNTLLCFPWKAWNFSLRCLLPADSSRISIKLRPWKEETYPTAEHLKIKFSKKSHPECCSFSPDGQMLATGSVDGFIEIWDYNTGRLKHDLQYQVGEVISLTSEQKIARLLVHVDNEGKCLRQPFFLLGL